jgi:O-acetyl-ADP-ribose deacetylase (regulator of RNase III)
MISYVTGDLLGATQKVIIHGCNNRGVMGSGVARQIRDRWPNVFEVYALKHKVFGLDLGDILPVATLDGKIIVNCITQDGFGRDGTRYVDYDAIDCCFQRLNDRVTDWQVSEIAMPRIGAGLGGGDWTVIEQIISKNAKNFIPIVYDFPVAP